MLRFSDVGGVGDRLASPYDIVVTAATAETIETEYDVIPDHESPRELTAEERANERAKPIEEVVNKQLARQAGGETETAVAAWHTRERKRSCGSKENVSSMSPRLRPLAPAAQPRWSAGVVIAAAILGAAAPLFGRQGPPLLPGYIIVGEALSSARAEDRIQFAARMFSAPDMESTCRAARAGEVVQLRSEVPQLMLRLGEPFRPGTLRITARDASGAVLPNVPLAVEVSGPPNVFARERVAQLVDEDGSMVPSRPASVRFRVRTICPGAGADTFVRADISPG